MLLGFFDHRDKVSGKSVRLHAFVARSTWVTRHQLAGTIEPPMGMLTNERNAPGGPAKLAHSDCGHMVKAQFERSAELCG